MNSVKKIETSKAMRDQYDFSNGVKGKYTMKNPLSEELEKTKKQLEEFGDMNEAYADINRKLERANLEIAELKQMVTDADCMIAYWDMMPVLVIPALAAAEDKQDKLKEALLLGKKLASVQGHLVNCNFTGCTCGAVENVIQARLEFFRVLNSPAIKGILD